MKASSYQVFFNSLKQIQNELLLDVFNTDVIWGIQEYVEKAVKSAKNIWLFLKSLRI